MKPYSSLMRLLIALVLVCLIGSAHAGTYAIAGRIGGVTDGDTLTLLDAECPLTSSVAATFVRIGSTSTSSGLR